MRERVGSKHTLHEVVYDKAPSSTYRQSDKLGKLKMGIKK